MQIRSCWRRSDQTSWIIAWSPPSPTALRHVATVVNHWRCFRCSVQKKHFLGAQILQKIFTTSWFCLKCQHLVEQETFMTNHWMECGTIFADKPSWRLMMSKGCIALARVWQFKAFREQTNIYPKQPAALILIPSGNSGNLTLQWRIPAFNGNSWDNHL